MNGILEQFNEEGLLEILGQNRIDNALEKALLVCERYNETKDKASARLDYALKLDMSEEQKMAIDKVISAYNLCASEYGRAAYFQGLHDGIRLVNEIREIFVANK